MSSLTSYFGRAWPISAWKAHNPERKGQDLVMDSVYSCPGDPEEWPSGLSFPTWDDLVLTDLWVMEAGRRSHIMVMTKFIENLQRKTAMKKLYYWQTQGVVPGDSTELETLNSCPVRNSLGFCSSTFPKRCIANVSAQGSTHKTRTKESHKNTWQYSVRHPTEWVLFRLLCLSACRVSEYRGTVVYG